MLGHAMGKRARARQQAEQPMTQEVDTKGDAKKRVSKLLVREHKT